MATPERAPGSLPGAGSGWLQTLLPVLERAGPLTALILGICAWYVIAGQQRELERSHTVSLELFRKLEGCYQVQLELTRQGSPMEPREN